MMKRLSSILIIQLYKQPELALTLTVGQWQSLLLVLRYHQLLARYQYIFARAGIIEQLPRYARHHLENARIVSEKQYQQVFFEAKELVSSHSFQTERKIFLKGAAYTLSGQTAGRGRIYSDIDLLIEQSAIDNIEQKLLISGWLPQPINKYDDNYYRKWSHEIPPLKHSARGTVLDLHHNLVPIISGRSPEISHFYNHVSKTIDEFYVLTPAAMTLHSMIHLFFNEEFKNGFRDLLDLDLLITENGTKEYWDELRDLAQKTGFRGELALAIRYLSKIIGTSIPPTIQEEFFLNKSLRTRVTDFIFLRVLLPSHPLILVPGQKLAILMAFLRGHFLKMPSHILLYHSAYKAYRGVMEYLLGKSFFEKEDPTHKF